LVDAIDLFSHAQTVTYSISIAFCLLILGCCTTVARMLTSMQLAVR